MVMISYHSCTLTCVEQFADFGSFIQFLGFYHCINQHVVRGLVGIPLLPESHQPLSPLRLSATVHDHVAQFNSPNPGQVSPDLCPRYELLYFIDVFVRASDLEHVSREVVVPHELVLVPHTLHYRDELYSALSDTYHSWRIESVRVLCAYIWCIVVQPHIHNTHSALSVGTWLPA